MKRLAISFIWMFTLFLAYTGYVHAEPVSVKYSANASSDAKVGAYTYSEDVNKTATFTISKKDGFLIKRLYWVDENGQELRNAAGDWIGKENFAGSDTIQGKGFMVKTADSHVYGGIYYWDRSGGTNLWRATGDGFVRDSSDPACPNPGVLDEWNYRRYPNCTDSGLSLSVTKVGSYYLDGEKTNPTIPDKAVRLDTLQPVDVKVDEFERVVSTHGTYGTTDAATTTYLGTYSALTKSSVRVNFRQTFGQYAVSNGQYKDWANPGARQMWWYSAFSVNFQAMTYRYEDKQLIVEWEPKNVDAALTSVRVRHMARVGPTGSFVKVAENVTPLAFLPSQLPQTRTENPDTSHGKVLGRNVSYTGYSSTINSGTAITVTLNATTQKDAYVSFFYEVDPPQFTGDFDIVPSTINYRESFAFVPKNFVMNGCVYQSHRYKIERNGTYTTVAIPNQNTTTSYTYSNYPWIIGVGSHMVSINIKTSCGESGWINPKTLTVNDMTGNRPPQFQIGFVRPQAQTVPIYEVVEGTVLNLIYIEDPTVPTPYDPDGDTLHFMGFDTENSTPFIRSLPQKYAPYVNGYHNVVMDELGYHYVSAQMRDQWGATATATTWINVVPQNPIAIAGCPASVKSGREVPDSAFDAKQSYSPAGRTINHTRDEWTNKKTVYVNETEDNIFETVQLHVYDSTGLKSLTPGTCTFIVEPDLPPIAKLDVPSLGIRNQEIDLYNRSYSPDGDKITGVAYKYKYDANNDGFENDEWRTINGGSVLAFKFTPTRVGKYLFYTKVTEEYGMSGDTLEQDEALLTLDVINDAPTISFDLEGQNQQPDLEPLDAYLPAAMLANWKLYGVNSTALMQNGNIKWFKNGNTLAGGTGKAMEDQGYRMAYYNNNFSTAYWLTPMQNLGYGNNSLSPYRAVAEVDTSKTQLLLDVAKNSTTPIIQFQSANPYVRTNESMFYIQGQRTSRFINNDDYSGLELFAYNKSKIGTYNQEPVFNGSSVSLLLSYPEGDPVEFRLTPTELYNGNNYGNLKYRYYHYPSYQDFIDKTNGTLKGEAQFQKFRIQGYFVSDRTIYQLVSWDKSNSYRDTYIHNGSTQYGTTTVYDIRTYDAFTGEFIASTKDRQRNVSLVTRGFTHGDHLFQVPSDTEVIETDRTGKQVARHAIPDLGITAPSGYAVVRVHQEYMLGNYYIMSEVRQLNTDNVANATYLSKLSPDMKLAWTVRLQGTHYNTRNSYAFQSGSVQQGFPHLLANPLRNEVLVNSFTPDGFGSKVHLQRIDMTTGSIADWDTATNGDWSSWGSMMRMDWNGNYTKLSTATSFPRTMTADGWSTGPDSTYSAFYDAAGIKQTSGSTTRLLSLNNMFSSSTTGMTNGLYVGDGMYLSFNGYADAYNQVPYAHIPVLTVGTPTTDPLIHKVFTLGQWVSDNKLDHAELAFTMAMHQPAVHSDLAGMSFRMSDPRNRYAVELDGKTVYLSKYINGTRTVIDSKPFIAQPSKANEFKLQFNGDVIKLYINSVPYFEATDTQFSDGYFGMFADRGLVDFGQVGSKPLQEQDAWDTQYAIWEEDDAAATIRTDNVIFDDPENDPIAELGWSLYHTPRFINNQGLSVLHGQTITDGELALDKVGDYKIALKGRDDPHPDFRMPDMTFEEYRKDSNEFVRSIIVHRRPIAEFDVEQRASDGFVLWTDYSRDPDRYESATHYSTEDTGIDYRATKGIMEKRFYYVTPNGEYVPEKLITPQETGRYEIALAVKDEYGAWSHWAVRYLDIGRVAQPNTPPVPGFTKSHATAYRGEVVTINSTAYDAEDGGRENLAHTYHVRNQTANGPEAIRSISRTSWTTSFDTLGTYTIRQTVQDSDGASAQTQQDIAIINRVPSATITVPASTNQNNPTKLTELRPEFRWTYSDPDGDAQTQYQVQIYRYGGYLQLDSGVQTGGGTAWTPGVDLPELTNMYVQVRVYDGYDWGNWSAVRYFYIETNQPPTADFTWLPQPVYEGDTTAFRSIVSDPDKDSLNVTYELTSPAGVTTAYRYVLNPTGSQYPATAPSVRLAQSGHWRMRLTVSDGKADPVAVEKTIEVLPLAISGEVKHTEQWNSLRQEFNREQSGNPELPRGYSVFWAGEKFVLEAAVTATGTATQAERVQVTFDGSHAKVELTAADSAGTRWRGELWEASYEEELKDGMYTFTFTAYYNNGIVRAVRVGIEIKGGVGQIVGVHRVK